MQIPVDKTQRTFSAGIQHQQKYVVSQSAHVMNLLADSTYSNKIGSPIRELMTNAVDSHIAAKSNRAIDVHIPTYNELYFSIRDYGEGLSFEALTKVYTTYGESTKSDSNDFNGCMGIGSKSPFAYAKSFTTISYYNGKKYICLNSKDEDNNPIFSVLSESDTDEPNGLEIKYKVNSSDRYEFSRNAARIFRLCPIDVNWTGEKVTLKQHEYLDNFHNIPLTVKLYDTTVCNDTEEINITFSIRSTDTNSVINMGFVEYPINSSFFKEEKVEESVKQIPKQTVTTYDWYQYYEDGFTEEEKFKYDKLLEIGLEINVDIGVVQMHMSREHLQYTKRVISVIKSCLCKIHEYISKTIVDNITNNKYMWDAISTREHYKTSRFNRCGFDNIIKSAKFNNETVKDAIDLPEGITCIRYCKNRKNRVEVSQKCERIYPRRNHYVYIADRKTGNVACAKKVTLGLNSYDVVYVFDTDTKNLDSLLHINPCEIKKLSDIEYSQYRSSYTKTNNVYKLSNDIYNTYNGWNDIDDSFDFSGGGIYCIIHRWEAEDIKSYNIGYRILQHLLGCIKTITNIDIDLYGVKKVASPKFIRSKHWMSLSEFCSMVYNANVTKHHDSIVKAINIRNIKESKSYKLLQTLSRYGDLPNDLKDFIDVDEHTINGCKHGEYLRAINEIALNDEFDDFVAKYKNTNNFDVIDNKYCFLKHIKCDDIKTEERKELCEFLIRINNLESKN